MKIRSLIDINDILVIQDKSHLALELTKLWLDKYRPDIKTELTKDPEWYLTLDNGVDTLIPESLDDVIDFLTYYKAK